MAEKKQLDVAVYHTLDALKRNKLHAVFLKDKEEALQFLLDTIPHDNSVGVGDSVTLKEIGILKELKRKGFTVYWPFDETVPKEERTNVARQALLADVFLSSSNAITLDGNTSTSTRRETGLQA